MSTPKVPYTHAELVEAYNAWVAERRLVDNIAAPETLMPQTYGPRQVAWENYCDVRDGLPKGTTGTRRFNAAATRYMSGSTSPAALGAYA